MISKQPFVKTTRAPLERRRSRHRTASSTSTSGAKRSSIMIHEGDDLVHGSRRRPELLDDDAGRIVRKLHRRDDRRTQRERKRASSSVPTRSSDASSLIGSPVALDASAALGATQVTSANRSMFWGFGSATTTFAPRVASTISREKSPLL